MAEWLKTTMLAASLLGVLLACIAGIEHERGQHATICRTPQGEEVRGRSKARLFDADGFAVRYEYDFRCRRIHNHD